MKTENKSKLIKDVIMMTVGTLISALGVYFFKIPNNFSTGGMSGISIILGNLIKSISPATFILILNIVFMILGFAFVGKTSAGKRYIAACFFRARFSCLI